MKKLLSISTVLFQLFITFITLFIIYMIFALLDMTEIDIITEIGFMIFQPVAGFILSSITILVCIILGLPIRLVSKINNWWTQKPYIFSVGIFIGLLFLIISFTSSFTELKNVIIDGEKITKEVPNTTLVLTGWFLVAFSLLHFYPLAFVKWFKQLLKAIAYK